MQESESTANTHVSPAALASSIVTAQENLLEQRLSDSQDISDVDASSPGEMMTLRHGLRSGGWSIATVLLLFTVFEEFDRVAMQVLGPDIQASLRVSDTVLLGLQSFGGVVLVLATLPFAWLADRRSRVRVLSAASALWMAFAGLTGVVVNTFQMGLARWLWSGCFGARAHCSFLGR